MWPSSPPSHTVGRLRSDDSVEAEVIRRLRAYWASPLGSDGRKNPHFEGLDLSERHLGEVDFGGFGFGRCTFVRTDLSGADLTSTWHTLSAFNRARLVGAWFSKAHMVDCSFREANLAGAILLRTMQDGSDYRGSSLFGADLGGSVMVRCDLRDADVREVNLESADLDTVVVAGAKFRGASGSPFRARLNIGTPEDFRLLEGDDALEWLRDATGNRIEWRPPHDRG